MQKHTEARESVNRANAQKLLANIVRENQARSFDDPSRTLIADIVQQLNNQDTITPASLVSAMQAVTKQTTYRQPEISGYGPIDTKGGYGPLEIPGTGHKDLQFYYGIFHTALFNEPPRDCPHFMFAPVVRAKVLPDFFDPGTEDGAPVRQAHPKRGFVNIRPALTDALIARLSTMRGSLDGEPEQQSGIKKEILGAIESSLKATKDLPNPLNKNEFLAIARDRKKRLRDCKQFDGKLDALYDEVRAPLIGEVMRRV